MKICSRDFFNRPTLEVLPELLGKYLVRKKGLKRTAGFVTEAEAYIGFEDKACHAAKGKTERTKVMFEAAGTWYVYLCYGVHWMLNIVTEKEGFPAAILIRGVQGDAHFNGPGKLTKSFEIDKKLNGKRACPEDGLWFEDRNVPVSSLDIHQGKRIGIGYAGKWQNKLWRYYLDHETIARIHAAFQSA